MKKAENKISIDCIENKVYTNLKELKKISNIGLQCNQKIVYRNCDKL